jgi:hypothetical protein
MVAVYVSLCRQGATTNSNHNKFFLHFFLSGHKNFGPVTSNHVSRDGNGFLSCSSTFWCHWNIHINDRCSSAERCDSFAVLPVIHVIDFGGARSIQAAASTARSHNNWNSWKRRNRNASLTTRALYCSQVACEGLLYQ